jgi:hypothetical protein
MTFTIDIKINGDLPVVIYDLMLCRPTFKQNGRPLSLLYFLAYHIHNININRIWVKNIIESSE